jgi:cysteine desulfurase
MKPIYLDYAATTPTDSRVVEAMLACLAPASAFGNPASLHPYGKEARDLVEMARAQVAAVIAADPAEIIWTSGATESNNLAIKGAARLYQRRGKHIVTMRTEHKAVLDTCQQLEKEGFQVTYLTPQANGLLDLAVFEAALRPDTVLVSIMHVNNETGIVQDIDAIANITAKKQILLHVDAAQTIGKTTLDLSKTPIDLLSLSAHKAYGPKGVGALFLRKKPRVRVEPLLHGGGHEQGMRSGTLPTHQIVGMGTAFALLQAEQQADLARISYLRNCLWEGLQRISVCQLSVPLALSVPHILNIRFQGMLADAILRDLPDIACSTASACQGKGAEGSYVLRALGLSDAEMKSALRLSIGKYTTQADIDFVITKFTQYFSSLS